MSAIEKKTKNQVDELREGLKNMSVDMRMFSLTMRSLYAEKAVGTDEEVAKEFRKLRDDTRNDAMVYIEGILPLTTEFVTSISTYFEYYDALTFDEWCENISMIRKEAAEYNKLCQTMLKIHEEILVSMKKKRYQAAILLKKMTLLVKEFEKKKEALVKKGGIERVWAMALCFIPAIAPIACPILSAFGDKDLAEATAAGEQAKIVEAAALAVREVLIPAFEAFIDGISKAAHFFSIMENELQKFENTAKRSEDDPQFIFFKIMNVEAKDMKSVCQVFYAALPDVKTDFQALPTEGTDRNYVDEWLGKQKKMIEEECKGKLAKNMLSAIADAVEKKWNERLLKLRKFLIQVRSTKWKFQVQKMIYKKL